MSNLPVRILLVEDNVGDARLIQEMLREATHFPCHLQPADRLDASLACLERGGGGIDVVLLDLSLPDSSGFDTFTRVHAQAPQVPIIILTGLDNERLAIQSVQKGAQDYLVKGQVDSHVLARTIRYAIERNREQQKLADERNLLRTVIDNLPDFVCVKDKESRFIVSNIAMARSAGFAAPDDLLGKTDRDFHKPDLAARFLASEQAILSSGEPLTGQEEFVVEVSGQPKWILTTKVPLRTSQGDVIGLVGIGHDITEHKRSEVLIRQQLATLTALYSGSQKLAVNLDSPRLAEDVARTCVEIFGLSLAWVGRALPDGRVESLAQYPAGTDYTRQVELRWDDSLLGSGPTGQAIRSRTPIVAADMQNDPRLTPWKLPVGQSGFTCSAAFPLTSRDKVLGALMLYSCQLGYFTPERVDFFQSYALQAAAALENARLFEETERRLNHMEALRRIDTSISSSLDLRTTLDIIVDQATAQLRVDAASVLLLASPSLTFSPTAGRGFRTRAIQDTHLRLGQGYAGLAALERRTVVNNTCLPADEDLQASHYRSLMNDEGFMAHVATPLIAKGQVVGVLEVFHRAPLNADAEWLAFLKMLAGQAAIAIDSVSLFDSLQRSNSELGLAYDATLEGWSRALDLRDRETEGHTKRVAEITIRLAGAMGMSGAELVYLRRGALLHDMGKMGIPDAILLKPGPLTEEEWAIMRKHPQYARDMLFPIKYLRPAIDIPYCHHEKWDGSGYPRGLKEEQIPLAARIFAVVDVWDALINNRPYRAAWSENKVREYILQASAHFDPQVVEAFMRLKMDA
jgi:PAS domain S-box-containing protein